MIEGALNLPQFVWPRNDFFFAILSFMIDLKISLCPPILKKCVMVIWYV